METSISEEWQEARNTLLVAAQNVADDVLFNDTDSDTATRHLERYISAREYYRDASHALDQQIKANAAQLNREHAK